jgi:hypothetical protein
MKYVEKGWCYNLMLMVAMKINILECGREVTASVFYADDECNIFPPNSINIC